ncbi:hypothetical protein QE361_000022 [Sphingomonas sp. SORGH_AS802]|uniref:hypothetical protein n=1 Tax=Sphingomonas sp. SORGH_AS_0802 TaxID=3041800 RepID=UPI002866A3E8|nr:hypothetical protein [Sphingomonas sp. SORGH_AS_0802]MDR6133064.1 hypothetical protein [Sphingomonas sp. SORGH_AS_0802]
MTRREFKTMVLAVSVLRSALAIGEDGPRQTDAVRLALRVLLPLCPRRVVLVDYWTAAGLADPVARGRGMGEAFNAIIRQLRSTGIYPH